MSNHWFAQSVIALGLLLGGCNAPAAPARAPSSAAARAEGLTVTCKAPHIADGDTLTCGGTRVRLWGVNAPELDHPNHGIEAEPGGEAAKARLFALTRTVVRCQAAGDQYDRYGRLLALCGTDATPDLNGEMIREGFACQWRRYSHGAFDGVGRDCDRRGKAPSP